MDRDGEAIFVGSGQVEREGCLRGQLGPLELIPDHKVALIVEH